MSYGSLKARVASELNRDDLSAVISLAVSSAIRHYEVRSFSFNSDRAYIVTEGGQANYALPEDFIRPVFLKIKRGGSWFPLDQRSWIFVEEIKYDDTTTSLPRYYATYDDQLWPYPIPDQSMTMDMSYVRTLATLSASSDSNAWTGVAEELIRMRAEADVYETHIRGDDADHRAQVLRRREREAFEALEKRYSGKILAGRLRRRGVFWDDP